MRLVYDSSKPPFHRITSIQIQRRSSPDRITPALETIHDDQTYTVAMRAYIVSGNDGFRAVFQDVRDGEMQVLVDEEHGFFLSTLLRRYFCALNTLERWMRYVRMKKSFNLHSLNRAPLSSNPHWSKVRIAYESGRYSTSDSVVSISPVLDGRIVNEFE